jgi:hypothetical protein
LIDVLIPLQLLWVIWLLAVIVSSAAAYLSCRRRNKPMGVALAGFALGAFSMLSFYTQLLYVPFDGSYELSILWSRWAISVNGLMILLGSLSALIVNIRIKNGTNDT